MQTKVFSEGSSTCQCKKGTLRACSDISSASNLLCSACREHGQSFTCDISLNRLLGPFVIFSTVSKRHTASLFFVKNFHISLNRPLGPLGVTSCSRTHADITFWIQRPAVVPETWYHNKLCSERFEPFLLSEQSFTGASLFPDTAAVTADILHKVLLASLKHFLPGARCKFYLRPAPKPWEEITFEILKGTLRACLYADF